MQVLQRMVADMLGRGEVTLSLSQETMDFVEKRCFVLLERIRQILADDTLDDPDAFSGLRRLFRCWNQTG